jgi:hypothetical protein
MAFALFGVVNPVQRIPMHLQVELKVGKALYIYSALRSWKSDRLVVSPLIGDFSWV